MLAQVWIKVWYKLSFMVLPIGTGEWGGSQRVKHGSKTLFKKCANSFQCWFSLQCCRGEIKKGIVRCAYKANVSSVFPRLQAISEATINLSHKRRLLEKSFIYSAHYLGLKTGPLRVHCVDFRVVLIYSFVQKEEQAWRFIFMGSFGV